MKVISTIFSLLLISTTTFAQSYDTLNFEVAANKIKIDSITGCWQVGKPSKIIFDTAYSPTKAIITDTLNPYPDSTYSTFDVKLPITGWSSYYSLKYTHRYDTENLKDGGYIMMFDCFTGTWKNLFAGSVADCSNPYQGQFNGAPPATTLFNGEKGYTGNSGGWITDEIIFNCDAVRSGGPDTLRLRFAFVSDTVNTGNEGWMIDNIVLYDGGGVCGGIEESTNNRSIKTFPNPVKDVMTIETLNHDIIKKIEIIDTQGKVVLNIAPKTFDKRTNLNVDFLRNGVYTLRVNDSTYSGYFIKE